MCKQNVENLEVINGGANVCDVLKSIIVTNVTSRISHSGGESPGPYKVF